jgi:uncharacterized OsmC-like protein
MHISALVRNSRAAHEAIVSTGATTQELLVPTKASGRGFSVNGGEFLMLALATCYCNDLYREGERLGIAIEGVEVEASAEFAGIGLAATNITYRAKVSSAATAEAISELLRQTDAVAEVHNTIRAGSRVELLDSGT